ncbi:MAG: alanine racemase [Bryobacteraceae bacterium]
MAAESKFKGPVWAEVSHAALLRNLGVIRRHVGKQRKVMAIVKADAYGHGMAPVARTLERAGVEYFGVTSTLEGADLRESGIRRPLLLLTGLWPGEEANVLRAGLTPTVTDVWQLALLDRAAGKLLRSGSREWSRTKSREHSRNKTRSSRGRDGRMPFHLKVDTGMNRLGVLPGEVGKFIAAYADCRHLRLEGVFTHFAQAEVFTNQATEEQQRLLEGALAQLRAAGIDPGLVHLANSAAIASRPATWADMVRPGALLYGYHQWYVPPEKRGEMQKKLPLRPVMSLRARVLSLKDVRAGSGVGYNARFVAERASRVAVLGAGYAEGVLRLLTNRGKVIIRGRCAPLVGIVSMDVAMADVTAIPEVQPGDIATFVGTDPSGGDCVLDASDIAHDIGTVTSDLLCAINPRVPHYHV